MNLDHSLTELFPGLGRRRPTCGYDGAHEHDDVEDELEPTQASCPKCGGERVARIVYGLLLPDSLAEDEICGGCSISTASWYCRTCEWSW